MSETVDQESPSNPDDIKPSLRQDSGAGQDAQPPHPLGKWRYMILVAAFMPIVATMFWFTIKSKDQWVRTKPAAHPLPMPEAKPTPSTPAPSAEEVSP